MPAERIAETLPFVNWTLLSTLAVGLFAAVVVGRLRTEATRGFLGFTAFVAGSVGALAVVADLGLPAAPPDVATDPSWALARRFLLGAFTLATFAYVAVLARRARAVPLAAAGLLAGAGTLVLAALGWAGGLPAGVPLAIQLLVMAAATGGVFAAMVLGHWYLVTPRLPERPLILFGRMLTAILALQSLLFVTWMATGAGAGLAPFEPLIGPWALFVWLRLVVGLLFPLVVSWAAVQTARTRSMESATGLLYIDTGTIAAGTILAAGLYFGAGLLV